MTCIERLAAFVSHHLKRDPLDVVQGRKIATWRTPRRQARQMRKHHTADAVDQLVDVLLLHQFTLLLQQAQLQHLGLDLDVISVDLTSRRLLPLAPQLSQVGNAALVERETVTLPLDHALGFELADLGPAAIKMLG